MTHPPTHPQMYICPTCSGDGEFYSNKYHEFEECSGCEGKFVVDLDRARELTDRGMTDERDVVSMSLYRIRMTQHNALSYDPDLDPR